MSHTIRPSTGEVTIWCWYGIPDKVQQKLSGYFHKSDDGMCFFGSKQEALDAYAQAVDEANKLT